MNSLDQDPVVIVSAARTPLGSFQGVFSGVPTTALGAVAIKAAVERAGLKPEQVDEVMMGCVLPAALGQAPARQATLGAGLPISVGATTVNKVCGSGMRAVMNVHDALAAGSAEIMVAGGMENMTNAPYMLPKARSGYRIGHSQIFDHMMMDGLEDAYDKGRAMGTFGEECAEKYQFTREAQDAFAIESVKRAQQASTDGTFATEIAPVTVTTRAGEVVVDTDEGPGKIKTEKIPTLKPAFKKDGTITAASSSSINDGAAALVLMRASKAKALGLNPIAKMCGHTTFAHAPNWFTTAPVTCIERLLKKIIGRSTVLTYGKLMKPLRLYRWLPCMI